MRERENTFLKQIKQEEFELEKKRQNLKMKIQKEKNLEKALSDTIAIQKYGKLFTILNDEHNKSSDSDYETFYPFHQFYHFPSILKETSAQFSRNYEFFQKKIHQFKLHLASETKNLEVSIPQKPVVFPPNQIKPENPLPVKELSRSIVTTHSYKYVREMHKSI